MATRWLVVSNVFDMFFAPFYTHSLSRPLYVEERFFENISFTSSLGSVRTFLSEKNYISAPCVLTQQKTQIVLPDIHVINLPPIWVIIIHYYPALSINLQYGWLLSIIIHHYQSPANMGDYPFWLTTLTNCACCGNFSHSLNSQLLLKHRKNCECCPVSQLIVR